MEVILRLILWLHSRVTAAVNPTLILKGVLLLILLVHRLHGVRTQTSTARRPSSFRYSTVRLWTHALMALIDCVQCISFDH